VLSKVAAYGFLRIVTPLLPDAAVHFQMLMLLIGLASVLYGSAMAFTTTDTRLILGYSSLAQLGFITLGIFSLTPQGAQGAVLQSFNHGLVVAPAFFLVGLASARSGGSEDLRDMVWLPAHLQFENGGESVALIRAASLRVGIVLVGIFDNAHWTRNISAWHSRRELDNIAGVLDTFDGALREIAARDPRIVFFDDRAWFARYWGGRDENGLPAYRSVRIGNVEVAHSEGDEPRHAVVADGHAGAVWNALWARDFVTLVNERFRLGLRPIEDAEIRQLLAL